MNNINGMGIVDMLNKWVDEGTITTQARVPSWYQTKKRIEQGLLFGSRVHPNVIFDNEEVRNTYDSLIEDERHLMFSSDEMFKSGYATKHELEKAIQRGEIIKYKRLMKPILYIKNNQLL